MKPPLRSRRSRRSPLARLVLLSAPLVACGGGAPGAPSDAGAKGHPDGAVIGPDGGGDAGSGGTVCSVASKGTSGILLTGTLLLPGSAAPSAGELLVNGTGSIVCAAASCSSSAGYAAATHVACPNGVISPSLINTHDHTEYATRGPDTPPTTRYQHRHDWRTGKEGATALPKVSNTTDGATIAAQEVRFLLGGATSVVGSGGVVGLTRNLADYKNPSFVEGLTGGTVFFDTFPLGDSSGTLLSSGCAYPKIEPASAAFAGGVFAPHVAEGINLFAENEVTCASQASNDLITAKTSVIHGVGTNAKDVNVIATAGAKLIWSPRSNVSLYGDTAPVTVYKAMGVTIALGTDWLPSGSMNMLRELECADTLNQKYFHQAFSDQDLFDMVTKNAAIAAGFDNQIGTLAAGMVADITVFDGSVSHGYRAVIGASVEDVHLVMRGGTVLYGAADIVSALNAASTCVPLSVCGASRTICVDSPPVTLAQIQTTAASIYPLFFCRGEAPTNEPTCIPYRDTYPNGIAATDQDGDGVADATDDCPAIFNPPRPLDNAAGGTLTAQADVDGDGVGDACDAKPLDPSGH